MNLRAFKHVATGLATLLFCAALATGVAADEETEATAPGAANATAVGASTGSTPATGAQIPLPNPGFEDGDSQWLIREKVSMSEVVPEAAHTGKMGLRVTDNDPKLGSNAFSAHVPAEPGQGYALTFWAKSSHDGSAGVMLFFYDAAGKAFTQYQPAAVLAQSTDWRQYRLLARAPETAASMAIWIHTFSTALVTVDLDDFALAKASGPEIAALAVPAVPGPGGAVRVRTSPAYVVLKLDDVVNVKGRVPDRWKKVADFIQQRGVKASFGIICNSLEGDSPQYYQWIKDLHTSGLIEFWCHGYTHAQWQENGATLQEFKGPTYEAQLHELTRSEELAHEKLGFPLTAFGAPFNATDDNTVKALEQTPDISVWMYGDDQHPAGKVVLDRIGEVNIENPLFLPNVDRFIRGYNNYPDRDYFVVQGHPNQWDDARFDQFVKIVDFLTAQKAIFTTPTEYARIKNLIPASATDVATAIAPVSLPSTAPVSVPALVAVAPAPAAVVAPAAATAPAAAPVSFPLALVANGDFSAPLTGSWTLSGQTDAPAKVVDAKIDGAPLTQALQLNLTYRDGAEPWDVRFAAPPTAVDIAKNDMLLVQFWGKATPNSRLNVVFQQAVQPFDKSIREIASLHSQWQKYTYYAPAHAAYPAGSTNFELQLGLSGGQLELAGLSVQDLGPVSKTDTVARYGAVSVDYYGGAEVNDDWIPAANARIEKIRKADLHFRVVDAAGKPVPGAQVTIQETKSAFRWGTAVNGNLLADGPDADKYRETVLRLFNTAVIENDLKWKATDGNPAAQTRAQACLDWLTSHGLAVRGHNMVWGSAHYLPDRLANLPAPALRDEITKRVADAMAETKGKVYVWDVVNEAGMNTELWDKVGWDSFAGVYRQARQLDPTVLLAYNDYNIANEAPDRGALRQKVEARIQTLLDAGAPLDVLGDQAHMGVPLTPIPRVLAIWDGWGQKFGKPIEVTEFDANIPDDAVHGKYVRDFLTAAFSDPNIQSFLMWGFWAKSQYLGESGSLFRADWSPRPAETAYEDLVLHQWRTNLMLTTDKTGAVQTRGFLGDYNVEVTAGGKTQTMKMTLGSQGADQEIRVAA